ncbi:hypothetical protein TWF173_010320 [Orbilia oligospora]|nr:hypothetical protein TWF173_010320 [Orbilia oligospora]
MLRKVVVVTATLGAITSAAAAPVAGPEPAPVTQPKVVAGYNPTPAPPVPRQPTYWQSPPKPYCGDPPGRGSGRGRGRGRGGRGRGGRGQPRGRSLSHRSSDLYEPSEAHTSKGYNPEPSPHRSKSRGRGSRSRSRSPDGYKPYQAKDYKPKLRPESPHRSKSRSSSGSRDRFEPPHSRPGSACG